MKNSYARTLKIPTILHISLECIVLSSFLVTEFLSYCFAGDKMNLHCASALHGCKLNKYCRFCCMSISVGCVDVSRFCVLSLISIPFSGVLICLYIKGTSVNNIVHKPHICLIMNISSDLFVSLSSVFFF